MQSRRQQNQGRLVLVPPLDQMVPAEHRLRRLDKVLDLSFVHEAVRDQYSQTLGRPSIDPEVILRLFLLQAIDGLPHVRELMRQVAVNLAYRWFIGYELDESLPDHSTLSKALDRFGDRVFDELFRRVLQQCKASGLIEGRVLHVDATTIRADLDRDRVGRPDSPDPDARYGKFPGKRTAPGYKQHTMVDGGSRVVVGLTVTPANRSEHDEAVRLLDASVSDLGKPPEAVCGDGAFASGKNYQAFSERGVRLVSPPPKARTYTKDRYYTVEKFVYDEEADEFICPAAKRLRYLRTEAERGRRTYRARRSDCRLCPLKSQCTIGERRHVKVSPDHSALIQLRADSRTDQFRQLYRSRAPVIEGIFAEAKQWHSLGRAWRRGLSKMYIQCWLVASVLNLKRLAGHAGRFLTLSKLIDALKTSTWRLAGLLSETQALESRTIYRALAPL
ncbi:MAG: transposase [candidate division Zixibacteria bacterium]|nr:transposase [candidate division Zixibacteria bacterium]